PELIQGLPCSPIELQRLERLLPGGGEVPAAGESDKRKELAGIHRAGAVTLRLEHGDRPVQVLRGTREVVELHGDDTETRVRAGDRPQVVRQLAMDEREAQRLHRFTQI